jgi:hypothetical protein
VPSVRTGVGPRWTEHTRPVHGDVDPVHRINHWKIIRYMDYSEILQRGPWTFVKSIRGPDFVNDKKVALDAKTDTSTSSQRLKLLGRELEDLKERV